MEKLFFKSDALIFAKDTILLETMSDPHPSLNRVCIFVKAHPGVNAEDILSEVQEIEDNIERGMYKNPKDTILTTTLTECPDLVVALTYGGFESLAYNHKGLRRERFAAMAKELVDIRDNPEYINTRTA